MKRRKAGHRDPTADRARVGSVAELLLTNLSTEARLVLLTTAVYGMSTRQAADYLNMNQYRVETLREQVYSRLNHPSHTENMRGLSAELDGTVWASTDLRIMLRKLGLEELDEPFPCEYCDRPAVPRRHPSAGGRPRRFCSDACRQAAYRARRRAAAQGQG